MKLGKVIGVVWASRKAEELTGCKMYIIQTINSKGDKDGHPLVVADPQNIGAVDDIVVYVTSTDATQAFDSGFAPVNASIVKLVDEIS
jgi:ethanolamine utilization protein EutN